MIVADTNLIAYAVIHGPFTADAEAVFHRDPIWTAPILWRSEMRNILARYVRTGQISLATAGLAMQAAEALVRDREYQVATAPVLSLAAASGCSAYDCEFVHLSQAQGCPLVTADEKVLKLFPGTAVNLQDFVR